MAISLSVLTWKPCKGLLDWWLAQSAGNHWGRKFAKYNKTFSSWIKTSVKKSTYCPHARPFRMRSLLTCMCPILNWKEFICCFLEYPASVPKMPCARVYLYTCSCLKLRTDRPLYNKSNRYCFTGKRAKRVRVKVIYEERITLHQHFFYRRCVYHTLFVAKVGGAIGLAWRKNHSVSQGCTPVSYRNYALTAL
jgi:hypothetical protein